MLSRIRRLFPQYAVVGRYRVRLPRGSRVPEWKRQWPLLNTALGAIADILYSKYRRNLRAIDIGANVGDTAALIRQSYDIPVLCVEGDPSVIPILKENIARMGSGIELELNFVGAEGATADAELIEDPGSNASLIDAVGKNGSLKLRSMRQILGTHPDFARAKLLKTDTEGFDFDILRQSIDFIGSSRPVVFFEYDPHFRLDDSDAGIETINELIRVGYTDFIYYDCFGHLLVHIKASNSNTIRDLHEYLKSNRRNGIAVYYFDVCAFHQDDSELAIETKERTG